jgi:hypothetical protein
VKPRTPHRPFLRSDANVPDRLRDVVVEAALVCASHSGAAEAYHCAASDLDALCRELIDRRGPAWLLTRLGQLSQQHLDAGEEHAEAADARLDVVHWLVRRDPIGSMLLNDQGDTPGATAPVRPQQDRTLRLLTPIASDD